MKKKLLIGLMAGLLATASYAGDKNVVETTNSDSSNPFYGNRELNIDGFGATNTHGKYGGGVDAKYFFHRNLGIGVEGYMMNGRHHDRAALATGTARFPIGKTRFAPYVFGGVGATEQHNNTGFAGQVGGGLETRLSKNVGVIADGSYNHVEKKDFPMVRVGLNFAF